MEYDNNIYSVFVCPKCRSGNVLINVATPNDGRGICIDCEKRKADIVGEVQCNERIAEDKWKKSKIVVKFNELGSAVSNPTIFAEYNKDRVEGEPFNSAQKWVFTAHVLVHNKETNSYGETLDLLRIE